MPAVIAGANRGIGAVDLHDLGIAVGLYHLGWVRTGMGTDAAVIGVEENANGLADRFEALSLNTAGRFETSDGRDYPL